MHKHITFIGLLAAIVLLAGCTTNYQYRANGDVTMADGDSKRALVYWQKDEGRHWYGARYEQLDSSVSLRICNVGARPFDLADEGHLVLRSKAQDFRIMQLDENGGLEEQQPERLVEGSTCGVIQVEGQPVSTDGLPTGTQPTVTILCRNDMRPDRYPAVAQYRFGAVTREETPEDRAGPDPCVEFD